MVVAGEPEVLRFRRICVAGCFTLMQVLRLGSSWRRLDDVADRAAVRLVCHTWRRTIDRGLYGSMRPASVPCAAVAAAFPAVRHLDLYRLHRRSQGDVAWQLQRLRIVLPAVTSLRLNGLR